MDQKEKESYVERLGEAEEIVERSSRLSEYADVTPLVSEVMMLIAAPPVEMAGTNLLTEQLSEEEKDYYARKIDEALEIVERRAPSSSVIAPRGIPELAAHLFGRLAEPLFFRRNTQDIINQLREAEQ